MKYLRKYEASKVLDLSPPSVTDTEKLAIGAIKSYVKELFFKNCKEVAYVSTSIQFTNIYFHIEFHSANEDVVDRLKELASFFGIEWGLEHGEHRIIQYLIIDKSKLKKYADDLETLAETKKYNM